MLKKIINYTNYNGETKSKEVYFHLSQVELAKMETSVDGGLTAKMKALSDTSTDNAFVLNFLEEFILGAYGVKTEDGDGFRKTPELREAFAQSAVYEALYMDLVKGGDKAVSDFVNGVIPQHLREELVNKAN